MAIKRRLDWESNTFAGLEGLDDSGRERVSLLGRLPLEPNEPNEPNEPGLVSSALPFFEELELDDSARLA